MIFIDAGYYYGAATELMLPDDDWTVYAFESNPELEVPDWVRLEAAWIEDGQIDFKINRDRNDASTINAGVGKYDIIKVPCIDFSKFVLDLPEDTIICSLDIEGAEFKVLEKMLKDHSIDKITVLDVEFHHRLMNDYEAKDAKRLIKRIRARGVIVMLKVPLE